MSIADELAKLDELRNRGALSAEEFERAKRARLLARGRRLVRAAPGRGHGGGQQPAPQHQRQLDRRRLRRHRPRHRRRKLIWRLIFVALLLFGGTGVLFTCCCGSSSPANDGPPHAPAGRSRTHIRNPST